jgi:hypothetical protein
MIKNDTITQLQKIVPHFKQEYKYLFETINEFITDGQTTEETAWHVLCYLYSLRKMAGNPSAHEMPKMDPDYLIEFQKVINSGATEPPKNKH